MSCLKTCPSTSYLQLSAYVLSNLSHCSKLDVVVTSPKKKKTYLATKDKTKLDKIPYANLWTCSHAVAYEYRQNIRIHFCNFSEIKVHLALMKMAMSRLTGQPLCYVEVLTVDASSLVIFFVVFYF